MLLMIVCVHIGVLCSYMIHMTYHLQRVPAVNCSWSNGQVVQLPTADVSVAVATDAGLITPIVADANLKSVVEISSNMRVSNGRASIVP